MNDRMTTKVLKIRPRESTIHLAPECLVMAAVREKILLVLIVLLVVCSIVYLWRLKGSNFSEIPGVDTTIYANTGDNSPEIWKNDSNLVSQIRSVNTTTDSKTESFLPSQVEVKLKKRFPNAIIIGDQKCGTAALYFMLCSHPLIKGHMAEMMFFDAHFERGLKWYINQMPKTKKNELTIERTAKYFVISTVPKRIYDQSKNVKLILIVRNPITRTVSNYVHQLTLHVPKMERQTHTFDNTILHPNGTVNSESIEINYSMYDVHYQRWRKWFDQKQILVVNGEELITNPVPLLHEVETFLNVSHYFNNSMFVINKKGFYCWKRNPQAENPKCLGSTKGRTHPIISNSTLDKMKEFFQPHVQRFCELADVKFNWCSLI